MISRKTAHDLTFTKFRDPSLPDFVEDIMEIKGHAVKTSVRLYPRNTPEILINLGEPIQGKMGSYQAAVKKYVIQGSKTAHINVEHPQYCRFLSIRFTTNGYYKLLGMSQNEFTNKFYELDDVIDDRIEDLIPALQMPTNAIDRFRILSKWLNREFCQREIPTKLLSDFVIRYLNQNPDSSVKQLVQKTGFTRKHLVCRFKEEAGLTIKEYQKIFRIYRVLKQIDKTRQISWAKLAGRFGFYDQSHFIKDFKQYTGLTPTDYLDQQTLNKSLAG